jgi:threonine aldolase
LYALEHHRARLAVDHARARSFAQAIAEIPGIELDPQHVVSNIVVFGVRDVPAAALVERCWEAGVRMLPVAADRVRAVFHLDLPEEAAERAAQAIRTALGGH